MDYKKKLSARVRGVKPSGIRKFFDLIDGTDVISLGIGEPDFVTPWHIRDAGVNSLEKGYTYYTPNAGTMELRKSISAYMRRSFLLEYSPATQITVTVGGSEAIDLAIRTLLDPGDEVLIPEPSFVCYGPMTTLAGGVPVPIVTTCENGFKVLPEQIAKAVSAKTKALILPYPNNPTGAILAREELEAIAKVVIEKDLIVIF